MNTTSQQLAAEHGIDLSDTRYHTRWPLVWGGMDCVMYNYCNMCNTSHSQDEPPHKSTCAADTRASIEESIHSLLQTPENERNDHWKVRMGRTAFALKRLEERP